MTATTTPPAPSSAPVAAEANPLGVKFKTHKEELADVALRFSNDTAAHQMSVLHEDGLYRHLRFRHPENGFHWFDLVTWPGNLTVTGDMGTFVFARTEDMFTFFRSNYGINPSYWAQKVRASEGSGVKEYSTDRLREQVADYVEDWVADLLEDLDEDDAPDSPEVLKAQARVDALVEAVKDEILDEWYIDSEDHVRRALDNFDHDGHTFSDTCEWELSEYTYFFLWCCHAVQWGIAQYDAAQAAHQAAADDVADPVAVEG